MLNIVQGGLPIQRVKSIACINKEDRIIFFTYESFFLSVDGSLNTGYLTSAEL